MEDGWDKDRSESQIETVEPPDFINSHIILECLFLLSGLLIALNFVYHRRKGAGAIPLFGL